MSLAELSIIINIILGLVALFQWWDRRSRNKAIENFIYATARVASRLKESLPRNRIAAQKADDLSENLLAVLKTLNDRYKMTKKN